MFTNNSGRPKYSVTKFYKFFMSTVIIYLTKKYYNEPNGKGLSTIPTKTAKEYILSRQLT